MTSNSPKSQCLTASAEATHAPAIQKITVQEAPAVVVWSRKNSITTSHLGPDAPAGKITLDIRLDLPSSTSFFKLKATAGFKSFTDLARSRIFLFIPPERIASLRLGQPDNGVEEEEASEARRLLGTSAVCLHFNLRSPASLVVPNVEPLTAKTRSAGLVLDSFRSLASELHLSIYLPENTVPKSQWILLQAVVGHDPLTSDPGQEELASLYRGRGGKIMSIDSKAVPASPEIQESSPPSYDELGPSPPHAPLTQEKPGPHKRRRLDESEHAGEPALLATCAQMIRDCEAKFASQFEQLKEDVTLKLQEMEVRIQAHVDERIEGQAVEFHRLADNQRYDLEKQIADMQNEVQGIENETDATLQGICEERLGQLQDELEFMVHEKIQEVEGDIIDHLSSASLR